MLFLFPSLPLLLDLINEDGVELVEVVDFSLDHWDLISYFSITAFLRFFAGRRNFWNPLIGEYSFRRWQILRFFIFCCLFFNFGLLAFIQIHVKIFPFKLFDFLFHFIDGEALSLPMRNWVASLASLTMLCYWKFELDFEWDWDPR